MPFVYLVVGLDKSGAVIHSFQGNVGEVTGDRVFATFGF